MPDSDDRDDAAPTTAPAAVKLPETEAERRKRRLDTTEKETDDVRSKRRASELGAHHSVHMENVADAHARYPNAPLHFEKGRDYTEAEIKDWNARRTEIDSANKAYHRAVKATFAEHQAEDAHITRVRAAKTAA